MAQNDETSHARPAGSYWAADTRRLVYWWNSSLSKRVEFNTSSVCAEYFSARSSDRVASLLSVSIDPPRATMDGMGRHSFDAFSGKSAPPLPIKARWTAATA